MYWVYASVRNREKKMEKYAGSTYTGSTAGAGPSYDAAGRSIHGRSRPASAAANLAQHKRVARQAFYYIGAFYVTWLFPTIFRIVTTTGLFPFPLLLLTAIFIPIQGALNLIVFIRPKFVKYRKKHLDSWGISAWFKMLALELSGKEDDVFTTRGRTSVQSSMERRATIEDAVEETADDKDDAFIENPKMTNENEEKEEET
jgi:hypothetical protein